MDDFDSLYSEQHEQSRKGNLQGIKQAEQGEYSDQYSQGYKYGLQLGKELVIYQHFILQIKKQQVFSRISQKVQNQIQKFINLYQDLKFQSTSQIVNDDENLKKQFIIIIGMLGIKQSFKPHIKMRSQYQF